MSPQNCLDSLLSLTFPSTTVTMTSSCLNLYLSLSFLVLRNLKNNVLTVVVWMKYLFIHCFWTSCLKPRDWLPGDDEDDVVGGEGRRIVESYPAEAACAVGDHILTKYFPNPPLEVLSVPTWTSCDWGFLSHLEKTGSFLSTSSPSRASNGRLTTRGLLVVGRAKSTLVLPHKLHQK